MTLALRVRWLETRAAWHKRRIRSHRQALVAIRDEADRLIRQK